MRHPITMSQGMTRSAVYIACIYWCDTLLQVQNPGDVEKYNDIILHETLRVAVCEALETNEGPPGLEWVYPHTLVYTFISPSLPREIKREVFLGFADYYISTAEALADRLDGQPMMVQLLTHWEVSPFWPLSLTGSIQHESRDLQFQEPGTETKGSQAVTDSQHIIYEYLHIYYINRFFFFFPRSLSSSNFL